MLEEKMVDYSETQKEAGLFIAGLRKELQSAEQVREHEQNLEKATTMFSITRLKAKGMQLHSIERDALAQLFVCWLHKYEQAAEDISKEEALSFMDNYVQQGLQLPMEVDRHVFYYRQGDLFLLQGRDSEALESYNQAVHLFEKMGLHSVPASKGTYGEYLKGRAKGLYGLGMYQEAQKECVKALTAIENAQFAELWRKPIMLSGVYALLFEIAFRQRSVYKLVIYGLKTYILSRQARRLGYGVRAVQIRQRLRRLLRF